MVQACRAGVGSDSDNVRGNLRGREVLEKGGKVATGPGDEDHESLAHSSSLASDLLAPATQSAREQSQQDSDTYF